MWMTIRNEFILIFTFSLALLMLIVAGSNGLPAPLIGLRLLLGLAFVLFVPGYSLQAALFPRRDDLDGLERLALSIGLSIAVVPLVSLILDGLPWGIGLWPVTVAGSFFIAACSAIAWTRRWLLPKEERFAMHITLNPAGWWAAQDHTNRILYGVLAGAVVTATVSAFAIVRVPKPGERFTEFYILGPEGLAENYPRDGALGQGTEVIVGIANYEEVASAYRVKVESEGQVIGQNDWVQISPGEIDERPVSFVPRQAGEDVEIEFFLYRGEETEPYRSLKLWLTVNQ
jgi:uncharacterized membrane protein